MGCAQIAAGACAGRTAHVSAVYAHDGSPHPPTHLTLLTAPAAAEYWLPATAWLLTGDRLSPAFCRPPTAQCDTHECHAQPHYKGHLLQADAPSASGRARERQRRPLLPTCRAVEGRCTQQPRAERAVSGERARSRERGPARVHAPRRRPAGPPRADPLATDRQDGAAAGAFRSASTPVGPSVCSCSSTHGRPAKV